MCRYNSNRFSAGSALVEFAFLLAVLLPVGFGMAMIGKLTDLKQTTEQASRYSAWEATVYSRKKLMVRQATELESRFFSSTNTPVSSSVNTGNADNQKKDIKQNPLWGPDNSPHVGLRDLGGVTRLPNSKVASMNKFDTGKASAAASTGKIVAKAGEALADFNGNSWNLVADGLLRSTISVPLRTTRFLPSQTATCGQSDQSDTSSTNTESSSVCVSAAGVILADGWGASGDAQAVSRVRSLVPASTLSKVGSGVSNLLGSFIFPELDPLDKAFGHVDMTVLPRYAK